MAGLVVTAVGVMPYAVMALLTPSLLGELGTSPACLSLPAAGLAMSVVGARATDALHSDLWPSLVTPRPSKAGGRRGRKSRRR